MDRDYLKRVAERCKAELEGDIMPFWLNHGLDREHGGVYTCLDRDGSLIDSTKSVWFQGRFGFVAAFAYNNVAKREEWLAASKSCIDFIEKYCADEQGHMYFEVAADGTPLRKRRYVFSECFAAIAMSEYSIASGDESYARKAVNLFERILQLLRPGVLEPKYEPNVRTRGHSITMILINTASRIREALPALALDEQINRSLDQIERYFVHPEFRAVLETVGENGEFIDTCNGRTINPGHAIETSWFILEEAKHRKWDKHLTELGLRILDWSWSWGWDAEYGGIINFRDCRNLPVQDYSQDMKFWWPQTEAMIASLYAYQATGDERYRQMHETASRWAYEHMPDAEYGEWFGYLHRDGTVAQRAKGNIFKGPFHIPRMLVKSYMLCQEML